MFLTLSLAIFGFKIDLLTPSFSYVKFNYLQEHESITLQISFNDDKFSSTIIKLIHDMVNIVFDSNLHN